MRRAVRMLNDVSFKVVGGGNGVTPPALVLTAGGKHKFLFQAPDGLQRFCVANRVRLKCIKDVLLTDASSSNRFGGLGGMCLTLFDVGNTSIRVHGPEAVKRFVHTVFPSFYKRPYAACGSWSTRASLMRPSTSLRSTSSRTWRRRTTTRRDDPLKRSKCSLSSTTAYCVQVPERRGKFDAEAAERLNVPRGRIRGRLTRGETITLDSGVVVRPSDVLSASIPEQRAIVLSCPSQDHVELLKANTYLSQSPGPPADVVFHFASASVYESDAYRAFVSCDELSTFGPRTQHVFFERRSR